MLIERQSPLNVALSHRLVDQLNHLRRTDLPWLWSDTKVQVTVSYIEEYDSRRWKPFRIAEIVITAQHDSTVTLRDLRRCIFTDAVTPVLENLGASALCDEDTKILVSFVRGLCVARTDP